MKQSNYCLKQLTNLVVYFSYKGLLTKNEKKERSTYILSDVSLNLISYFRSSTNEAIENLTSKILLHKTSHNRLHEKKIYVTKHIM